MIWTSTPWRNELLRVADRLERRQSQLRWTEQSLFLVERDIMVSAYSTRKLYESFKLSAAFSNQQVSLESYPVRNQKAPGPNQLNWHHIDRFYDLNKPEQTIFKPLQLCNQIIHSRVFLLVIAEHPKTSGFYVSSDYHSRKCLYFVDMNVFARLIRQAGEERIERLEMERYSNGDYSVNLYSLSETGSEIP